MCTGLGSSDLPLIRSSDDSESSSLAGRAVLVSPNLMSSTSVDGKDKKLEPDSPNQLRLTCYYNRL